MHKSMANNSMLRHNAIHGFTEEKKKLIRAEIWQKMKNQKGIMSRQCSIQCITFHNSRKRSHSSNVVDQNESKIAGGRYGDSSNLSNYGNNLMKSTAVIMDQSKVYENQQKKFNIISYYPKEIQPNLKQYPRLTL